MSADPFTATSWTLKVTVSKSTAKIEHLTSGTKNWFRVAAVGSDAAGGQGPWSDPATKVAP